MKVKIERILKFAKVGVNVLRVANALLSNDDVIDLYGEHGSGNDDNTGTSSPCDKLRRQSSLINALKRLEKQAGAISTVVLNWDEAFTKLKTEMDFITEDKTTEIEDKLKEQKLQDSEAKEKVKEILRPLTYYEKIMITKAMYDGEDDEIINKQNANGTGTVALNRKSFRTLGPTIWLNDEVINCYIDLLNKRDEELCQQNGGKSRSNYFFKSFFITKLRNVGHLTNDGQYEYENVKRWSLKVPGKDIFEFDKIFFPINQGNFHWTLACVFMEEKKIQYYDSMHGDGTEYIDDIFKYIKDEHMDKKKESLLNEDEWQLISTPNNTPRQNNGNDCGVFTCMFADFLSIDCPLEFGQFEHIDLCRERIALSILQGKASICQRYEYHQNNNTTAISSATTTTTNNNNNNSREEKNKNKL